MRRRLAGVRYELGLLAAFVAVPLILFGLMFVDLLRLGLAIVVVVVVALVFRSWVFRG